MNPSSPAMTEPPERPESSGNLLQWVIGIGMVLVLLGLLYPAATGARENARRAGCNCNLKQIGLAMKLYSADNKDRYSTDSAGTTLGSYALITNNYQTSWSPWICPSDNRGPGGCNGSLWRQHMENPFLKTNIGYAYNGFGLTESAQPDTPILCDLTTGYLRSLTPYAGNTRTHKEDGGNVLYVDGHVSWTQLFPVPMYHGKNP